MITNVIVFYLFLFFQRFYLFIFRQRGRVGERKGEKHQCVVASSAPLLGVWPTTQACALPGNRTGEPLIHRLILNPWSHTSQDQFYSLLMKSSPTTKTWKHALCFCSRALWLFLSHLDLWSIWNKTFLKNGVYYGEDNFLHNPKCLCT